MADRPLRVLTIGPAPAGASSRGGMATVMTLMREFSDPDVRVRVVPTFVDASAARKIFVGLRGMLLASWLVATHRADVLHAHLAHGGSVIRKGVPLTVARLAGVPTVVHAHSYDFAGWLRSQPRVVRFVVRRLLRADRWVVLASNHRGEFAPLLKLPTERIVVLHNPVVLPGALPPVEDDDPRVTAISLGRLGQRKGSYDVVTAVSRLDPEVRASLRVVLAGDGEVSEVRQAVADAGVGDVVEVRSWLTPTERDLLAASAQVFLLPSYEEGLPMALLEAMGRRLAPVVTPVGGIPNVVTDGREGLLVQPGDTAELARAITAVVQDPAMRERLRDAARQRSEDFDVERWYAALHDLWLDLTRGG